MKKTLLSLALTLVFAFSSAAFAQADIEIVNLNAGTGQGFDDPTPAAAVGGNTGLTLGAQRLNAFVRAAEIWGAVLNSGPKIRILASFEPLACNATSAVLGSAGSVTSVANFPGAVAPNTWYPLALANKLAGEQVLPTAGEIRARFNSRLGAADCLPGPGWYLGLDANEPTGANDLVAVLLHEFAHGLGFASFINKKTGTEFKGWTDVYSRNIRDNWTGISWAGTTPSVRRKSTTAGNIVWMGPNVTNAAPLVLSFPPHLVVNSPASVAGAYEVGTASFGGSPTNTLTGDVAYAPAAADGTHLACAALPAGSLSGKIALVDRGTCDFVLKAKNVQNAGASAMVVADWDPAFTSPQGMSGSDPTVTIPAVRITKADGDRIKSALTSTVNATLKQDSTKPLAGTDAQNHVLLYAPSVVAQGSSVSHFDTSAFRNLLMEPNINGDLTHEVGSPTDLTLQLLKDIGW